MRARLIGSLAAAVAAAICAMTVPAWAGYSMSGYNFQVVQSGQGLADAGISYLENSTWNESGGNLYAPISTSFTLPSCSDIDYARLYLDIWGGMPMFTATVTVSVNGTQLAPISIGGMSDANPTYSGTKTCVYGSGYGVWEVAVAGLSNLLYTNGAPNAVTWTVNDPTGNFDGRTYDASLVTVYTSPSLHQTLDYDLAEGNAYMQNSGDTGAPSSRTLTITGVNTANVSGATYSAGYILGLTGYGGYNSLSLSNSAGTLALGNPPNDVAQGTDVNFGPSVVSSNVAGSLAATSTVQYSVAMPGGSNNLVPTIGLLAITHPLPVNGVWSSTAGGSWNTAANWQGSNVPTSSGDTATFGDVIGRAAAVVTLDGACTLRYSGLQHHRRRQLHDRPWQRRHHRRVDAEQRRGGCHREHQRRQPNPGRADHARQRSDRQRRRRQQSDYLRGDQRGQPGQIRQPHRRWRAGALGQCQLHGRHDGCQRHARLRHPRVHAQHGYPGHRKGWRGGVGGLAGGFQRQRACRDGCCRCQHQQRRQRRGRDGRVAGADPG